ncbi:hypothetical protein ACQCN2_00930 [Brevibacillus ginsengisoli]|uniref:hypothetical protein n=1 Tax=Brevibacillus ginsengisoli TaxID=363854 RepID=UPI003CEF8D0B
MARSFGQDHRARAHMDRKPELKFHECVTRKMTEEEWEHLSNIPLVKTEERYRPPKRGKLAKKVTANER